MTRSPHYLNCRPHTKRLLGLPGILPAECAPFLNLGARCDAGVTVEASPAEAEDADARVELVVAEGAAYVEARAQRAAEDAAAGCAPAPLAALVVDVGGEASSGAFCEARFLRAAAALLGAGGVLVLDVDARSPSQLRAALRSLAEATAIDEAGAGASAAFLFDSVHAIPVSDPDSERHSVAVCRVAPRAAVAALPVMVGGYKISLPGASAAPAAGSGGSATGLAAQRAAAVERAARITTVELGLWLEGIHLVSARG